MQTSFSPFNINTSRQQAPQKPAMAPKFGQQDGVDDSNGDAFELSSKPTEASDSPESASHFIERLEAYLETDVLPLIEASVTEMVKEDPDFISAFAEYYKILQFKNINPDSEINGNYNDRQHLMAVEKYNQLVEQGFSTISQFIEIDEINELLSLVIPLQASENFTVTDIVIEGSRETIEANVADKPDVQKALKSFSAIINNVDTAMGNVFDEQQKNELQPLKARLQSLVEGDDFKNPLMKLQLSAMASDDQEEAVTAFAMLPNIIGRGKYKPTGGLKAWNELVDIGLNYPNPSIQQITANSLFSLPDEQWVPITHQLLHDDNEQTLILLFNALNLVTADSSFLKNENLKAIVEFGINYKNPDNELLEQQIQTIAIKGIGKLPDVDATAILEEQLSQQDEERLVSIVRNLLPETGIDDYSSAAVRLQEIVANSSKLFEALKSYMIENMNVPEKRKQVLLLNEFMIAQQEINHYKARHNAKGTYL